MIRTCALEGYEGGETEGRGGAETPGRSYPALESYRYLWLHKPLAAGSTIVGLAPPNFHISIQIFSMWPRRGESSPPPPNVNLRELSITSMNKKGIRLNLSYFGLSATNE